MLRTAALALILCLTLACAGIPHQEPLRVEPLRPGTGEQVVVDHALLIFDSSGSIADRAQFPAEKALFESFVSGMPDGGYAAGLVAFGGYARQSHPVAAFDRPALSASAREIRHLSEGTPIDRVFEELQAQVAGKGSRAAVVVFSDGLPTDPVGRSVESRLSFDAAKALAEAYQGPVCFHTVQMGNDPDGAEFLRKLAGVTDCGTSRSHADTMTVAEVERFEREVFLGLAQAPPVKRAAPGDADGDGVTDDRDQCPGTPAGARADARGCWSIPWLEFATNSAEIRSGGRERLVGEVLPVLQANPDLRVRIDGHTDARGSDAYNQDLSERRARAVRDFLVGRGVDAGRLESKGWGESKPIASNDSAANLQRNRRTELTVLN